VKGLIRHGTNAHGRLEITRSGGVVLTLPNGSGTNSNDVTWPVAEHYRP
jgi:hypothetical protein